MNGDLRRRERAAEVLLVAIEQLRDGAVDVHLVQQIEAAAQVEAERHGAQADRLDSAGARDANDSAVM